VINSEQGKKSSRYGSEFTTRGRSPECPGPDSHRFWGASPDRAREFLR